MTTALDFIYQHGVINLVPDVALIRIARFDDWDWTDIMSLRLTGRSCTVHVTVRRGIRVLIGGSYVTREVYDSRAFKVCAIFRLLLLIFSITTRIFWRVICPSTK